MTDEDALDIAQLVARTRFVSGATLSALAGRGSPSKWRQRRGRCRFEARQLQQEGGQRRLSLGLEDAERMHAALHEAKRTRGCQPCWDEFGHTRAPGNGDGYRHLSQQRIHIDSAELELMNAAELESEPPIEKYPDVVLRADGRDARFTILLPDACRLALRRGAADRVQGEEQRGSVERPSSPGSAVLRGLFVYQSAKFAAC